MKRKFALCLFLLECHLGWADPFTYVHHHWYLTGDAVFMRRSEIQKISLVKDLHKKRKCPDECDDFTVMNTKMDFDFDPGFRTTLIYSPNVGNSLEAVFLWVRPWHGSKAVAGNESLFFPFNLRPFPFGIRHFAFDYFDAHKARADYHSRFWDAEFNYWRHFSPRHTDFFSISGILGGRYFHLNEGFKLTFTKHSDQSHYSTHTQNHIGGLQAGLNLEMAPTPRLSWDFTGKFGLMLNWAQQRNLLLDYNDTVVVRRVGEQLKRKWGLFGDLMAQLTFQLCRPLNIHAGYELIIISGLALAPEQVVHGIEPGSGRSVYANGRTYIHGFYAGMTFCF